MQEGREQLLRETTRAVIAHFELDPKRGYHPLAQELTLSEDEQRQYTHKFYVIIADCAAIVYRKAPGQYVVMEDQETDENEQAEDEAYSVLMAAAHYLEVDIRKVRKVEASEEQPPAGAAL